MKIACLLYDVSVQELLEVAMQAKDSIIVQFKFLMCGPPCNTHEIAELSNSGMIG